MTLPESKDLPINLLAACFNKTSATYKFYWFISILQSVEHGDEILLKRDLFSKMLSNAWYCVNFFRVSFGEQDLIQKAIHRIKEIEQITIDETREKIIRRLNSTQQKETENILWHFNRYVPQHFLSPWFPKKVNETDTQREKRIYVNSKHFEKKCLYGLYDDRIEINPSWLNYLKENSKVLKDFCYWNLVLYLQSKNPNVPDVPNKLIRPATRNSLTKQRTIFWDLVIGELGSVNCIYTDDKLTIGNYAVEHFIPFNFVSHDLIWNLIPANKSFNSFKNDKLPPLEKYFDPFFYLQKNAIEIIKRKTPKNKFLEEYLPIFPDLDTITMLPESLSKKKFRDILQPLITIASNNGFEFLT